MFENIRKIEVIVSSALYLCQTDGMHGQSRRNWMDLRQNISFQKRNICFHTEFCISFSKDRFAQIYLSKISLDQDIFGKKVLLDLSGWRFTKALGKSNPIPRYNFCIEIVPETKVLSLRQLHWFALHCSDNHDQGGRLRQWWKFQWREGKWSFIRTNIRSVRPSKMLSVVLPWVSKAGPNIFLRRRKKFNFFGGVKLWSWFYMIL